VKFLAALRARDSSAAFFFFHQDEFRQVALQWRDGRFTIARLVHSKDRATR
jgi:hypothetical protein